MRIRLVGLVAAALVLVGPLTPAHAATKTRYVANNAHTFAVAMASAKTGIALEGDVTFVAARDRITLTLDDALDMRTKPVVIVQGDNFVRLVCMRDNVSRTVTGLEPGIWTSVWILDATYISECQAGATTGRLFLQN